MYEWRSWLRLSFSGGGSFCAAVCLSDEKRWKVCVKFKNSNRTKSCRCLVCDPKTLSSWFEAPRWCANTQTELVEISWHQHRSARSLNFFDIECYSSDWNFAWLKLEKLGELGSQKCFICFDLSCQSRWLGFFELCARNDHAWNSKLLLVNSYQVRRTS